MTLLSEKVVVVTGVSSGIGLAIVQMFVEHGAHVIGVSRREPAGLDSSAGPGSFTFLKGDISTPATIDEVADFAAQTYGRVDVLVNNAAFLPVPAPLDSATNSVWEQVLSVNVLGVARLSAKVLPLMRSARYGRIINVGSVLSIFAVPTGGPYTASKHAVLGLTRTQALEYGPVGITANCLLPGGVDTEMFRRGDADGAFRRHVESRCPLHRLADPREIAATALFLASALSSYINGHALMVDGGITLGI